MPRLEAITARPDSAPGGACGTTVERPSTVQRRRAGSARSGLLPGSVSVDLDTLSDYARGYGTVYDRRPDPVYALGLTRFLDVLKAEGVQATFFVIGRDAEIPEHREVLARAAAEGHELANHTMTHPRGLASMPLADVRREVQAAHAAVSAVYGSPVTGFRAPCYDVNGRVLSVLRDMGYLYDSSVHPTMLTPVIDLAVLIKSGFRVWEARPQTYAHVLASLRPYYPSSRCYWARGRDGGLLEFPLSSLPWMRLPFYGTFTQATGMAFFRRSLAWMRRRRCPLNFHFHAVELIDLDDEAVDPAFRVHPGLNRPADQKIVELREMLALFKAGYDLRTLEERARAFKLASVG